MEEGADRVRTSMEVVGQHPKVPPTGEKSWTKLDAGVEITRVR